MAVLTAAELADLRMRFAAARLPSWTKAQVNAAVQALEDAVQSTGNVGGRSLKAYLAAAIETAAPGVFTAGQKDDLFVMWCRFNAARGGIL